MKSNPSNPFEHILQEYLGNHPRSTTPPQSENPVDALNSLQQEGDANDAARSVLQQETPQDTP
ncbi:hypothetical protein EBT31_01480 [bacterium]|nr:hypothetical protein [bacterium]